jgi:hypothetical protein
MEKSWSFKLQEIWDYLRHAYVLINNTKEIIHRYELFYSTLLPAAGNNRKVRDVAGALLG